MGGPERMVDDAGLARRDHRLMGGIMRIYLCVAPDGRIELWNKRLNYYVGDLQWELQKSQDPNDGIVEIEETPAFWGREIIDEWDEVADDVRRG